jgi:RNA polymerase sigma-70 factor (ECF subfamily)
VQPHESREGDVFFYDKVPLMSKVGVGSHAGSLDQLVEDPAEMAALHDRLYPRLFRYARFRINDSRAAEDLASETFLKLLEAARKPAQHIDNIEGWLMGTLSNLASDHLRRRYRQPESEVSDNIVSGLPNPQAILERSERHDSVAQAMANLTDDQQQVLSLRFGAEMSLAKTAQIMNRQENAVKALQYRALRALRRHLDEKAHE